MRMGLGVRVFAACVLSFGLCVAQDPPGDSKAPDQDDGENASNPLSKVKNTDLRLQYFDNPDGSERWDFWVADGAFMATDKLKIKYELHYWDTDITGTSESEFESFHVKGIYFPKNGALGQWKYRMAVGVEWILDFGCEHHHW